MDFGGRLSVSVSRARRGFCVLGMVWYGMVRGESEIGMPW